MHSWGLHAPTIQFQIRSDAELQRSGPDMFDTHCTDIYIKPSARFYDLMRKKKNANQLMNMSSLNPRCINM